MNTNNEQQSESPAAGVVQAIRDGLSPALRDGNEVAEFAFIQPGFAHLPAIPQFNLTRQVGAYPVGATIGTETLRRLGYSAPTIPEGANAA